MTSNIEPLKALQSFLPLRVLKTLRGWGSFLTINTETHPANEASISLWIYLCDWELSLGPDPVLDCGQVDDHIYETALRPLVGTLLIAVAESGQGKLLWEFDSGHRLELSSNPKAYEANDDLFLSYLNDKCFVCYSHDRGFYFVD
jgi:hypothetical protein